MKTKAELEKLVKKHLTKKGFLNWAQAKNDGVILGYSNDCDQCPISNYMSEKAGQLTTVTSGEVGFEYEHLYCNLPSWAIKLIWRIDALSESDDRGDGCAVYKDDVETFLGSVII